ncbi:MAG: 1,4-dihydroxy-2-naphthoate polyprenyltransferase, partial [uncultured Frankineae bacterium]
DDRRAVARGSPTPHAARRRGAGPGRQRSRRRRGRLLRRPCGARPGRGPVPAGRRQPRQRLQRRHPRHRRAPGRAAAPGRVGSGRAGGGPQRRGRLLRDRGGRRHRAVGARVLVAADRGGGVHRRRLGLHRHDPAVRLPRSGRGVGLRLLRPGRGARHHLRAGRAAHLAVPGGGRRLRCAGLRDPRGQQPARHPDRRGRGQAHARRRARRPPHPCAVPRAARERLRRGGGRRPGGAGRPARAARGAARARAGERGPRGTDRTRPGARAAGHRRAAAGVRRPAGCGAGAVV